MRADEPEQRLEDTPVDIGVTQREVARIPFRERRTGLVPGRVSPVAVRTIHRLSRAIGVL
jgi:hypothetical protein